MLSEKRRDWPGLNEDALLQNRLSEATGIELVVPGVYQRPHDAIRSTAWNSALTTGALTPMDPKRFADLNAVYTQLQFLTRNAEREDRAAAVLSALSVPQELTPETRTRMFQALYEIDTARFMFRLVGASALADSMKALGWNDRAEIDQYIADGRADDKKLGRKWRPCIQPERNPFAASS